MTIIKPRTFLTDVEKAELVKAYKAGASREDLAFRFDIAAVTLRRILAEEGIIKLTGYKTKRDEAILTLLATHGLDNIDALRNFITQAKAGRSVQQSAQDQA